MKLSEFLAKKKQSEFSFERIEYVLTDSNEKVAILHLSNPLASVTGSQSITDADTDQTTKVEAFDVETVKIHEEDMEDDGFEVNEDGTGTYKGDLRLDVAKRTGEVWLKSTTFAAGARAFRTENQKKRNAGILGRMKGTGVAAGVQPVDVNQ